MHKIKLQLTAAAPR